MTSCYSSPHLDVALVLVASREVQVRKSILLCTDRKSNYLEGKTASLHFNKDSKLQRRVLRDETRPCSEYSVGYLCTVHFFRSLLRDQDECMPIWFYWSRI